MSLIWEEKFPEHCTMLSLMMYIFLVETTTLSLNLVSMGNCVMYLFYESVLLYTNWPGLVADGIKFAHITGGFSSMIGTEQKDIEMLYL